MTAVFIFFSYLFLSVVFSLATIDEAGFTYRTYRDNQIDKVEFCTRYYSLKVGVSDEILDIMNPETIRYCPQTYTGEKQFDSKTFTVVGISEQILFFDETATREMLTDYGKQRIDNSEKTIFFEEYTKEIFQKAYKHNLVANGTAADSSEATLSTLLFFKNVFFIIGGIFAVISVFSLLNHVISSLTKFKKEIAVLLCFKVEKSSIFNVFLLDSLFPIVLAFILILPFNALVNTIVNHIFSDYYKLILTPMTLRFGFIALILGITVVELVLSLTALLLKISKMNRAASLKNNDSLK